MKRSIIQWLCMSLCTAALLLPAKKSVAGIVPSANGDIFWYNNCTNGPGGSSILGFNTALINPNMPNWPTYLMVSAYNGNGTAGGVVFRNSANGFTFNYPFCGSPYYLGGIPDIIVTNDATNPGNTYNVAVACDNQLYIFRVVYPLPTIITVTFTGQYPIMNAPTPVDAAENHIDVIAEYGNTGITGLPFCDTFMVTYNDVTGGVMVDEYSLASGVPVYISGTTVPTPGTQHDVAAIQRYTCPVCTTVENVALVGSIDIIGTNDYLDYAEWKPTTGTLFTTPTVLTGPVPHIFAGTGLRWPRIDAPDDYNINYPGVTAYYKIATEKNQQTFTYDILTGAAGYDSPAGAGGLPLYNTMPTVAFGGNGSTEYQVAHHNTDPFFVEDVYMEPIDWTNSLAVAGGNTYHVPFGTLPVAPSGPTQVAISTPCNDIASQTLVSWTYINFGTGLSDVYYKLTGYPYAFKQPHANGTATVAGSGWELYPNPAMQSVMVDNLLNADRYQVTDMPGRMVQQGTLQGGQQALDIARLSPGSYIMTLYKAEVRCGNKVFVKQ
jgi:Secretion system C-terminal sorting domain